MGTFMDNGLRDSLKNTDNHAISEREIQEAGQIIKNGGLVAFPTETVYGLGGDALNSESSRKIYAAKGRPSDNPLIVHIADIEDLAFIAKDISDISVTLAEYFWPGPLTMVFNATDSVPRETTGGLSTVAVRMPSNKIALAFIRAAGGFVAAPSANTSGRPSPTKAAHVKEDLGDKIDLILEGGASVLGLESTIVDMTGDVPVILRPGFITKNDLERTLGKAVLVDPGIMDKADEGKTENANTPPKAPGMKYRHYAPRGRFYLVKTDPGGIKVQDHTALAKALFSLADQSVSKGEKVGILCSRELASLLKGIDAFNGLDVYIICPGSRDNIEEIAAGIYDALREFDDNDIDVIYGESFPEEGVGAAVFNRLKKAAGGNIILV